MATNQSMCQQMMSFMFEYQTLKIVNIGNKKIGVLNRLIQGGILAYIMGYVIVYSKGYQIFSRSNAATTSKIKGIISTSDLTDDEFVPSVPNKADYKRVWDVTDLVVPSSESDAFFLTTNLIITKQTYSSCAEEPKVPHVICTNHESCQKGRIHLLGNGVQTGHCVPADGFLNETHVCEIEGWCPAEFDTGPLLGGKALFAAVVNFTVLLKNYVEFPLFGVTLQNIRPSDTSAHLSSCNFDPVHDPTCPVFRIGDILKFSKIDINQIGKYGGVIRIVIDWNCDLDYDKKYCKPTYKFHRIDDPFAKVAKGWNFRYVKSYGNGSRTLIKAYGITFRISTLAKAGKFYTVNLAINIGSGLGLLALATIICDLVVLHCVKKKELYKRNKFRFVDTDQDIDADNGSSLNYGRSNSAKPKKCKLDEDVSKGANNAQQASPQNDSTLEFFKVAL